MKYRLLATKGAFRDHLLILDPIFVPMHDLLSTVRMLLIGVLGLVWRPIRAVILGVGVAAVVLLVLACTRIPFDVHRWLGSSQGQCVDRPEAIVVLGGSGMPSGPELLRLHQAAERAVAWPEAEILIVHPGDPTVIREMEQELTLRGVDPGRITLVNEGDNTRAQALACSSGPLAKEARLAIITAPENMYRTVRAFGKVGFASVCGAAAWDHAMDHHFAYAHRRIGGKAWVPDVSEATDLRYTFWNYVKLEITCLREFVAIGYYRLNGWI